MRVVELTYPGLRVQLPNKNNAWEAERIFYLIEHHLSEAVVALNLFESVHGQVGGADWRARWERDAERRREIGAKYEPELQGAMFAGGGAAFQKHMEIHDRVEIELKHEKWAAGQVPREYESALLSVCAKGFVHALNNMEKLIGALSRVDGVPASIAAQHQAFKDAFPDLRGVRDSLEHIEDRGRGLDRYEKPLVLKPVDNALVKAPAGGALILLSFNGNRFGGTLENGEYGDVEVSAASVELARACIQTVIDSFQWDGQMTRHYPS